MLEPLKYCLTCGQMNCTCYYSQPNTSWTLSNPIPLTEAQQCIAVKALVKEFDALELKAKCENCQDHMTPKEKSRLKELAKMLDYFV